MSSKKRLIYLDASKFIAICLVCIGHSYLLKGGSSIVSCWIYTFHVPMFMLISGFLSYGKFNEPFVPFLIKKTRTLLLPALVFSFLASLSVLFIDKAEFGREFRLEMIGGMWFLRVLYFCFIVAYVGKRFIQNDWLTIVVTSILFLILPYGSFLRSNFFLLIFWSGYMMSKYKSFWHKNRLYITIVCLLLFLLLPKGEPDVITLYVIIDNPLALPQYYVSSIAGALFVINFVYYLCKTYSHLSVIRIMSKIGAYTLGIYCVQSVLINRVCAFFFHIDMVEWLSEFVVIPILGIVFTFICYYIVLMLRHSLVCRVLLFGDHI